MIESWAGERTAALHALRSWQAHAFRGRQPVLAAVLVGVGLGYSVPQARLADRQLLHERGDRCVTGTSELDRAPAKPGAGEERA
jgi:hypothetical protein